MSKAAASGVGRIMRAVKVSEFGAPEVLKVLSDVAIPVPTGKQVLIKIASAGVNPVDTYRRSGNYPLLLTLPFTPGSDASGIIEKTGPEATKFKSGTRVYTSKCSSGSYAEYGVAAEDDVHVLADTLSFQQGASIGVPYYTAFRSLFQRGNCKASETVLVHGASGAVGIAALQLGSAYGLNLFGTAGTADGLKLIKEHGAMKAFNHNDKDYVQKIMDETEGEGVNVILEMLANVNLQKDLQMLAPKGRVLVIGNRAPTEIDARLTMTKETSIIGVSLGSTTKEEFKEITAAMHAGFVKGYLQPVVGKEYPLEKVVEAHHEVIEHKEGSHGKIVLNM
ncbi:quinone oxidoreductase-like [Saccoglossus kowalevskii]|uniref:Quinone oxidoreductase-like n=1 Tax=Saccoglossus kowalevskii TaxID=10224 RepID=A0ABM0GNP1_SACKO|nr:PREDICTED: quinone oxidoreductase-like [Saccoglossus kowalevskii]